MSDAVEGIARIELDGVNGRRPVNVYLIAGERPALVGVGHPTQSRQLVEKLRAMRVEPGAVDRIIANSWSPEVLGGWQAFPRSDLFVMSHDLVAPHAWNAWVDGRRAAFLGVADEVLERIDKWQRAEVDVWLADEYPTVTNHLQFIPMRPGHTVAAGALELEVIEAPGPNAGHALLWCADRKICFTGEVEIDGLPEAQESIRGYMIGLERAMQLEPEILLPLRGAELSRGKWTLKRLSRLLGNYLSNAPTMLLEPKTILDIVDGDLGYLPDHPAPYIQAVLRHRPFMEELVAAGVLNSQGEGLDRRYSAA